MKNRIFCAALAWLAWHAPMEAQQVAYYVPNPVQIPALGEKGDGTFLAGLSLAGENAGYNLMAMYSPRNHVAVLLNHNGRHTEHNWGGTNFSLTEIGAGAYYPEGRNCASAMIGYGRERIASVYDDNFSQISTLWMQRFFLQGAFSYTGPKTMFGVGIRMILLDYRKGLINVGIGEENLSAVKAIEKKSPIFYHELAFQAGIVRYDPISVSMHITTFFPKISRLNILQSSVGLCMGYRLGRKKVE